MLTSAELHYDWWRRILRNMQDLPFNMASHVGIFAERMFANLAQTFPAARIEVALVCHLYSNVILEATRF